MMQCESNHGKPLEQLTIEDDDLISMISSTESSEHQRDSGNSSDSTLSSRDSPCCSIKKSKKHFFDIDVDEDEANESQDTSNLSLYNKESFVNNYVYTDERSLKNLLNLEDYYRIQSNYFIYVQNEIKPWMRKMLAKWMLDVCKNQSREDDVFVLAMNILDRFLSLQTIGKRHLQLLGTVCMFIAAKLRSAQQFSAETLVIYTANSITIEELLNWEQFVLQRLRWDICSITPYDFLPYFLNKIELNTERKYDAQEIKNNLSSFISHCSTEFKFSMLPASMISSACLYLTLKHMNIMRAHTDELLIERLNSLTTIDSECLRECIEQISEFLESTLKISLSDKSIISQVHISTTSTNTTFSTTTNTTSTGSAFMTSTMSISTKHYDQPMCEQFS